MELGAILYFGIATCAMMMTYREQREKGLKNPLFNALGFVVCILWPFLIAAILHARYRKPA